MQTWRWFCRWNSARENSQRGIAEGASSGPTHGTRKLSGRRIALGRHSGKSPHCLVRPPKGQSLQLCQRAASGTISQANDRGERGLGCSLFVGGCMEANRRLRASALMVDVGRLGIIGTADPSAASWHRSLPQKSSPVASRRYGGGPVSFHRRPASLCSLANADAKEAGYEAG